MVRADADKRVGETKMGEIFGWEIFLKMETKKMESPKKSIGRVGFEDVDDFNDFEGFFEGAYRRN